VPPKTSPLPIDEVIPAIAASLGRVPNLVLRAPPGAGKTTRVPAALLDQGLVPAGQRVLVLEPRRVAARAAARRIASERAGRVGDEVGYQVRFEDRTSIRTRIAFLTEGLLVRRLQSDPTLDGVAAVVLDEFHERSIHADLALAFLREIQETVRPELRILVMSATLDAGPVAEFLRGAPLIDSPGRLFPVELRFEDDERPLRFTPESVVSAVRRAVRDEADDGGDLLVFLPGAPEIRRTESALAAAFGDRPFDVRPLYGELAGEAQDRALEPAAPGRRKIVLATNIAETSLTIEGVSTVIDSGLAKVQRHDPARGFDRLDTVRISRASAEQRAGRAGRTRPGRAFRMWTRIEDQRLSSREAPEIARIDLAPVMLEVLAWTGGDLSGFEFFEPPPEANLLRARRLLEVLGAVDPAAGRLTDLGRRLRGFPLHPRLAAILCAAHAAAVLRGGALLAALASERDVVRRGRPDAPAITESLLGPSDLLLRAEWVEGGRRGGAPSELDGDAVSQVRAVRDRLVELAERTLGPAGPVRPVGPRPAASDPEQALLRALLAGFPDRVARRREPAGGKGAVSDRVVMVGGRGARMAKESVVKDAPLLLAIEVDDTRRAGETGAESLVRIASKVEEPWLAETGLVRETKRVRWNPSREAVEAVVQRAYQDLVLAERADPDADPEAVAGVLAEAAGRDLSRALPKSEAFHELLGRVALLREAMPELELPALDDAGLVALLPHLCVGKRSFADLARIDLVQTLEGELGWSAWQAIERHAPERIEVPSGSRIRLRYEPDGPPVLAVRLQEVFGMLETPRVAAGRVAVKMELLAPNQRPVQVTQDLRSFWASTYAEVRKELRARYPKHSWPEDPTHAVPERRPGRRS
jgi:ATP-dependent helicase HrpB